MFWDFQQSYFPGLLQCVVQRDDNSIVDADFLDFKLEAFLLVLVVENYIIISHPNDMEYMHCTGTELIIY